MIHHENPVVDEEAPAGAPGGAPGGALAGHVRSARNPVSSLKDLESESSADLGGFAGEFGSEGGASGSEVKAAMASGGGDDLRGEQAASAGDVGDVEFRSLSSYIDPLVVRPLTEDETHIVDEAKAQGYEDGFRIGEEKATLQTKQMFGELLGTIEELVHDIAALKKNVLFNAQENFFVLCNALSQAIFKREISLNPERLAEVIKRAIDEAVPEDEIKVILNSRSAAALKKVLPEKMKVMIRTDDTMDEGRFRIDSKLTVIDGDISQLIYDMIQQADLSLFESKDKAS